MTEAPTNHGTLTDKEGAGLRGCRILVDGEQADRAFTVLDFVQKYLDNIEKKARVCFTTKDGKISKIWPEPVAPSEAQKVIDAENAAGDARQAANDAYVKELAGAPKEPKYIEVPAKSLPKETTSAIVPSAGKFNEKIDLIKAKIAPDCTDTEFELLMYMANKYGLDPLVHQIWAVKYQNKPALIFAGRDGFLEIAHRSKQFDGMRAGTRNEGEEIIGWCEVHRKDMSHPFYVEVYLKEYLKPQSPGQKPGPWQTMPRVMIQKVAESSALRRAFSVSGLYCPEEIDTGDR